MIWKVPEIIHTLSQQVELFPGDLIFTGTPAGVGPVRKGDVVEATIVGLTALTISIG
jgi:fumarylpyruvate hydrolase